MGPLHAIRNQYPGINAHLHSYWQGRCGWSRFHTNHIADLLRALRPALLPRGYDADIEPSLQIRRLDDAEPPRFPESDLTIDDRDHECAARPGGQSSASVAELVTPLAEGLFGAPLSANDYGALKIYETVPGRLDRGEPIARIELLSPSNKPGGRDARVLRQAAQRGGRTDHSSRAPHRHQRQQPPCSGWSSAVRLWLVCGGAALPGAIHETEGRERP